MKQEVKAKLRFLRMGPTKVRLVVDLIRGKKALESVNILSVLNKRASKPVLKLLQSAIANAKHNYELEEAGLVVKAITVDSGPTLKRWMPRAMGRAAQILKRTSHINIVLEGEIVEKKKAVKKVEEKTEKKPEKKEVKKNVKK